MTTRRGTVVTGIMAALGGLLLGLVGGPAFADGGSCPEQLSACGGRLQQCAESLAECRSACPSGPTYQLPRQLLGGPTGATWRELDGLLQSAAAQLKQRGGTESLPAEAEATIEQVEQLQRDEPAQLRRKAELLAQLLSALEKTSPEQDDGSASDESHSEP